MDCTGDFFRGLWALSCPLSYVKGLKVCCAQPCLHAASTLHTTLFARSKHTTKDPVCKQQTHYIQPCLQAANTLQTTLFARSKHTTKDPVCKQQTHYIQPCLHAANTLQKTLFASSKRTTYNPVCMQQTHYIENVITILIAIEIVMSLFFHYFVSCKDCVYVCKRAKTCLMWVCEYVWVGVGVGVGGWVWM